MVLAAPKDPSDADRIHPSDVQRVIEAARSKFDYVIVDTPAALTEIVLAAFDMSNQLYVMATLDLPSVRHMGVFLNTLEKLKIPADNVKLILNKAERDVGLDVDQVTRLFPQGFTSVLPYAKEVTKSVNVGTPVLAFTPTADVSRRMAAGMSPLLPEANRAKAIEAEGPVKRNLFARMFHRSPSPIGRPSEATGRTL
jgi:pilus assembly protein CpaE